ncbi:myb/SANT-like DNA-binding domain-containing protein 4 [Magallana gigas]|uniref:myb/SANT-like DNA-binding domain-containing protein 4 n=1 Tax=Magallana gigas TaxID=29159 RepID=UPI00333E2223
MDAKKQRKANFSDVEVEVLVDAVGTSYKVLYGKFSPCLTNNMKTMAWESVTEKVNAVSLQCTRGVVEVKKKWQDMQSAVKKKEAQRRKNLTQTGGGPSQLPMLKPWEEKILQLIPQSAISGIEDGVDTSEVRSSLQMSQKPSCLEIQPFIVTEVPVEELENLDTNSDVPVVSQSEEESSLSEPSTSKGKRKAQTFNEYSYGSRRLIEIEEEKLSIKKQRLEIEKERLEILKNFYALFSSSNVQSVCNLLSEF